MSQPSVRLQTRLPGITEPSPPSSWHGIAYAPYPHASSNPGLERKCGKETMEVYVAIGGFPGHPHVQPGPLWGYRCRDCGYEEEIHEEARPVE